MAKKTQDKSVQFTPNPDQSKVKHLRITVDGIRVAPSGHVRIEAISGNVGFGVRLPYMPPIPFEVGEVLFIEYPEVEGKPSFSQPFTAIYRESEKPQERNMNIATIPTEALTMTSREIAELLEVRHDNVKRTIDRLVSRGTIAQPPMEGVQEIRGNNREYNVTVYKVGKRDSYIIVAQLSPEFTARLVDRWQELEQQVAKPDPMAALSDPAALRQMLIGYTEKVMKLEDKVQDLEPKAQALNRLTVADGCMNPTVAAKNLQVRPKQLFDYLKQNKWIYRRAGAKHNSAYQEKIQQGLLKHKVTIVEREDGTEKVVEQVLVTAKGLAKLASIFTQQTA